MYAVLLFQFCIWELKLKKKVYSFNTVEISFLDILQKALNFSKAMRVDAEKLNFPLCRHFGYGVRPGPPALPAPRPPQPEAVALGDQHLLPVPVEWRPP